MEKTIDELYTAAESGNHATLPQLPGGGKQILPLLFLPIPFGGYTALHIAAYHGHKTFVEKLLALYDHEGSLDLEGRHNFLKVKDDYVGNTALHEAVRGGDHTDIVELLLRADPTLADHPNNNGESPLFIAADNGHLNAVKVLLPRTRSPYERSDGRTPLHHAMDRQHYEVVKTLAGNHELVKAEDNLGMTVLHVAALKYRCPEKIVEQLLEPDISFSYKKTKIDQWTALHIAASKGNLNFVRCILRIARRSAEIVDKDGRHALHLAVEKGEVKTVKELLKAMPRLINVPDNNGLTALKIAIESERAAEFSNVMRFMRVKWTLCYYNARLEIRKAETLSQPGIADANEQSSRQAVEQREFAHINTLSVIAVLIATLSFQSFIQPPAGTNGKTGVPVLAHESTLKKLMGYNCSAYFFSILGTMVLFFSLMFPLCIRRAKAIYFIDLLVFAALIDIILGFLIWFFNL